MDVITRTITSTKYKLVTLSRDKVVGEVSFTSAANFKDDRKVIQYANEHAREIGIDGVAVFVAERSPIDKLVVMSVDAFVKAGFIFDDIAKYREYIKKGGTLTK